MSAKHEHAAPAGKLAANVAKAEQLLARFARDGVRHFIDGAPRAAASGRTFATQSPIDDRVLGEVAAGDAADIDGAADAAQRAFPAWRDVAGDKRRRAVCTRSPTRSRRAAEEIALVEMHRHRPADPLHVRRPRCAAPRTSASSPTGRPRPRDGLSLPTREHLNYTMRQPIGPVGVDHAVEHAVHAVDVEDRAGARGRLHRRAQAGRMEPAHRDRCSPRS